MVVASSKVRPRGQITLPKEILEALHASEGEQLTWIQIGDGIAMLSKASFSREQMAEKLLASLFVGVGPEAEKKGIREEEDLDAIVKTLRKHSFETRHGKRQP